MSGASPTPEVAAGQLLLATPEIVGPAFAQTVVLMLDVGAHGALGVVLNRPTETPVGRVLDGWGEVVTEPSVLFEGGPVETNGALAVGLLGPGAESEGPGVRPVVGRLCLLDLDTPPEVVAAGLVDLRIFAGYAGWGSGQLQREIEEGSWYVVPALAADVFGADVTDLFRDVLRRQPGDLAFHATRPADPSRN